MMPRPLALKRSWPATFLPGTKSSSTCSPIESGPSGGLGLRPGSLDPRDALASIDADRHVAIESDATDDAVLIAIIVHGVVLSGAVVPDRDVALLPAPPHGVFGRGDM